MMNLLLLGEVILGWDRPDELVHLIGMFLVVGDLGPLERDGLPAARSSSKEVAARLRSLCESAR